MSADAVLRSRLIHAADTLPKGSPERTKILALLRESADFPAEDIGEVVPGALEEGTPEEGYQGDHFRQQEFHELGDKQQSGQLGNGQADDGEATTPVGEQEAQVTAADRPLYEGLVRLAHSNPEARGPILNLLREAGYIQDDKSNKMAQQKRAADFAAKTAEDKQAAILDAMGEEDRTLRAGLIRLAASQPEHKQKLVAMVVAFDKEVTAALTAGEVPEAFKKQWKKNKGDDDKGDDDKGKDDKDDKGKDDKDDDSGKPWEKKKASTKNAAITHIATNAQNANEAAAAGYKLARNAQATKDQALEAGRLAAKAWREAQVAA